MTIHVGPRKGWVSRKTCFSGRSLVSVTTEAGNVSCLFWGCSWGILCARCRIPLSLSLPVSIDFNSFVNVHYWKNLRIDSLPWAGSILGHDGWRTAKNIVANRCPVGLFNIMYLTERGSTNMHRHWKNAAPSAVWKLPVISEALGNRRALGFAAVLAGTINRSSRLVLVLPFLSEKKKSESFTFPKQYQSSQLWPSSHITSRSS